MSIHLFSRPAYITVLERVVDGRQNWVFAPTTASSKVVGRQIPDHCSAEPLLENKLRLRTGGFRRIVTDPLVALEEEIKGPGEEEKWNQTFGDGHCHTLYA